MNRFLLTLMLATAFLLDVNAQTLPDEVRVSYSAYNKPLDVVIKELSDRSGVNIVFSTRRINARRTVSLNPVTNEPLKAILNVILSDYRLKYEIVGDQIVIMRDSRRRPLRDPVISGYITDATTGEPLIGANIYLTDRSIGTVTNDYGFYSIQLKSSTYRIQYSYVGYKVIRNQYYISKDTIINIEIEPQVVLNDVVITDSRTLDLEETSAADEVISQDELTSISTLGGEPDIIRVIGMLPGISSGPDGVGGINIRGGSADQNLILLDGVPVYNAGHALGVYSIFNSDIIKSARLLKGSFPSRYGGRLSSVLDVRTKEGSNKRTGGAFTLSTLASKFYLEGPITKNGSSFLVSARRTFIDPWIKEVTKYLNEQNGDEGFANYYFYDINTKLNLKLNQKTSMMLGAYRGMDEFSNDVTTSGTSDTTSFENIDRLNWDWGNSLYYLRLNNQLSKRSFSNLTLYYSDYSFSTYEYDRFKTADPVSTSFTYSSDLFSSGIEDVGVKFEMDYILNTNHWIKWGLGGITHRFTPSLIQVTQNDHINSAEPDPSRDEIAAASDPAIVTGKEAYLFVEDEFNAGSGVVFNIGAHNSYINTGEKSFFNIQPRVAAVAQSESLIFKLGASKMVQYLHMLSSNGLGLPSEIWLPSTDNIPPEESWVYSAEFSFRNVKGFQIGVEGYYKDFQGLISYDEGGTEPISDETDWQASLPRGDGEAYGVELFINKRAGRTTWFSNYTYSISNRFFPTLNNGNTFSFRYDKTHNFKVAFVHRITDNAEFSLNWNASSGSPYTSPNEIIAIRQPDGNVDLFLRYDEKNNVKLPGYQRLDVSFSFFSDIKWGKQKFTIGLYNMLNKKNPFFIDISLDPNNPRRYIQERYTVLPIFPSLSYSLAF